MEFLVVEFDGDRGVVINDATGAWRTNEILQLQAGSYVVALEPPNDFLPASIPVVLAHTAVLRPKTIRFDRVP